MKGDEMQNRKRASQIVRELVLEVANLIKHEVAGTVIDGSRPGDYKWEYR